MHGGDRTEALAVHPAEGDGVEIDIKIKKEKCCKRTGEENPLKRREKRTFLIAALLLLALGLGACGGKKQDDGGGKEGAKSEQAAKSSDSYVEWNGDKISSLSEEGAKQKTLTIPAKCKGFTDHIFLLRENSVEEVRFESDEDIPLDGAFTQSSVKKVQLPAKLTKIGDADFQHCESLEEIEVPASVTEIGNFAFAYDGALKTVKFAGEGVQKIGNNAFQNCKALKDITLPDTVTEIGKNCFLDNTALSTVRLPQDIKKIGGYAFAGSGVTSVYVPEKVTLESIEHSSFAALLDTTTAYVVEGSWFDQNYDSGMLEGVFDKKEYYDGK